MVIKRGADSTLVRETPDAPWQSIATLRVESVVDTTAAGDSFAAGYLSRRLLGNSALLSAEFGNKLAARGATKLTGMDQASFPWQCLYFFPLPQGHGSFLPTFLGFTGRLVAAGR